MKNFVFLFLVITSISFAGNSYDKVYKQIKKINKLESQRKYTKALEKSKLLLLNPFATIKPEDKVTNFLNHAELLALIYKNSNELSPYLDSATTAAKELKAKDQDFVKIESAKLYLLCLDYLKANEILHAINSSRIHPSIKRDYWVTKAKILARQGYYKHAIETLDNIKSTDFNHLYLLQKLYTDYGDHKTAKNLLARIKQLSAVSDDKRELALTHFATGVNYDQLNRVLECNVELDQAVKLLRKSKALKPRNILLTLDDLYDYAALSKWQIDSKDKKSSINAYKKYVSHALSQSSAAYDYFGISEAKSAVISFDYEYATYVLDELRPRIAERNNPAITRSYFQTQILSLSSNNQFDSLDIFYDNLLGQSILLFDKKSPNYNKDLLDKAIYFNEYKNQPLVALEAFEKGYEKNISPQWYNAQNENQYYLDKFENLLIEVGYHDKALKYANTSLKEIKKQYGDKSLFYGNKLERIAEIQIEQTHIKEAIKNIEKVYQIYASNRIEGYDLAHLDQTLCKAWIIEGDFSSAHRLLKKAQKDIREVLDDYNENDDLVDFANIYLYQGKYSKVQTALLTQLESNNAIYGNNNKRNIKILNKLSEYYLITGDFVSAEKGSLKAIELSKSIYGKLPIYAESL